jgi:RNA polymerase II subunit A-like phosphatase
MVHFVHISLGSYDYTGFSDTSRASIQMTHSAFGPTVSLEEAQRLERATADHLLKSRKLSLIVDLDQTIVHATVDPTVGEWIGEGEAWEERRDRREQKKERAREKEREKAERAKERDDEDGSDDDSSSSSDEDEDETESEGEDGCNPNWEALKDVKKFRLGPESFGATPSRPSKGKQKVIENEGCMYYIKPRSVLVYIF